MSTSEWREFVERAETAGIKGAEDMPTAHTSSAHIQLANRVLGDSGSTDPAE